MINTIVILRSEATKDLLSQCTAVSRNSVTQEQILRLAQDDTCFAQDDTGWL